MIVNRTWDEDILLETVPLHIQRFIVYHGWERAIHLLKEAPYSLKVRHNAEYGCYVFTYDMIASDLSHPICQEARGLMIDEFDPRKIVAIGFNKFFNYGEQSAQEAVEVIDLEWMAGGYVVAREKLDGSIIKISAIDKTKPLDWDNILVSTNNVVDAATLEVPVPFGNVRTFYDAVADALLEILAQFPATKLSDLPEEWTYIFELTGPYNRVVVPYGTNQLRYLGRRNVYTTEEQYVGLSHTRTGLLYELENNPSLHAALKVGRPLSLPLETEYVSFLDHVQTLANELDWKEEGFVVTAVVAGKTYHVKVKGKEYLAVHRMRGDAVPSPKRVVEMLFEAQVDDFLGYFPEYANLVGEVRADVTSLVARLREAGATAEHHKGDRKALAERLLSEYSAFVAGYGFAVASGKTNDMPPSDFIKDGIQRKGYKALLKELGYKE